MASSPTRTPGSTPVKLGLGNYVIPTPSVSVKASVAASTATCIGTHCDAWEWGGSDRFPSVTIYVNAMLTLTLPLPLGVGGPLENGE